MSTNNTNNVGIHCKVACNDQYRRFLFMGTEFNSLNEQVKNLLNLGDEEFVLKYKDNEGDLITISTNEELAFAISFSDGSLLRLTATVPLDTQQFDVTCEFQHPGHFRGKIPREFGHGHGFGHGHPGAGPWRGRGGRRGGRCPYERTGCEGGRFKGGKNCDRLQAKLARMTFKRDVIQTQLNEIPAEQASSPDQQQRLTIMRSKLERLQSKIHWIESQKTGSEDVANKMEEVSPSENVNQKHAKWQSHEERHKRKCDRSERRIHKKGKDNISEEEKAEINFLNEKIAALKEPAREIKKTIKTKKQAWRDANEVDGQLIGREIDDLKSQLWEVKKQIRPLRWRIDQIYHN